MNEALLRQLSIITKEEERLLKGEGLDKAVYTSGKSFVVDSEKMLESGKLISVRPHTRFVSFPPHAHNYVELIYMCSGKGTHMINNALPLTMHAGELLFLNQHVTHGIERAEVGDVAVNFIVMPQFFDTAFDMIGADNVLGRFLVSSLQQDTTDTGYLHFKVADVIPVQNLVENMLWSIVQRQPNENRISRTTMGLLFLQLLNHTQYLEMAVPRRGNNALVVEALREVEENYQTANLSAIAKKYGVTLAYLSHLMKETTGSTFTTLLQQKRLAKATQLLQNTGLSVQEIITAVGYENTSYFYRIFREEYGISPKKYRRG